MSVMYLNLIHRADGGEKARESLDFQIRSAHKLGLKTTILMSNSGLQDKEAVAYAQKQHAENGVELGLHMQDLITPDFKQKFNTMEGFFYLLPRALKESILKYLFDQFQEQFGYQPGTMGSYLMDAWTLRLIRRQHPSIKAAITNCFEEGVKMYQGNNRNWFLFSDGGPWGPFLPSKESALCPADSALEEVGIVALPHLNRDMIMALVSRDDLFSSHVVNLFRAKINEADQCPYWQRFTDQWIDQAKLNGWSYYSWFVSSPWLTEGWLFADDWQEARRCYVNALEHLAKRRDEGAVKDVHMAEFAGEFRRLTKPGEGQACHWKDVLAKSRREMFWYVNSQYRITVDMHTGGTVCDLRPYSGRLDRDMGPEALNLWNGNYPYVISSELRGSHWRSHLICAIIAGDAKADISDKRATATTERVGDKTILKVSPLKLKVGAETVVVETVYTFDSSGRIKVERRLLDSTSAEVTLREEFRGIWGTTEYAEDMRGIILTGTDTEGRETELVYNYHPTKLPVALARRLAARVPQVNCRITLGVDEFGKGAGGETGEIATGMLSDPFYCLAVEKKVAKGGVLTTWLQIEKL